MKTDPSLFVKLKMNSIVFDSLLFILFLFIFPLSVFLSLYYPNVILEQGLAHRIFYLHVSVAWVALYAPGIAAIFGILYLIQKDLKYDTISYSMNKMALLFAFCVLFSGPIWAKSAWGVPWDWTDARLQSFFILVISLLAYFVMRTLVGDVRKKASISAFLTLISSLNSLVTWGAIRWMENPGNHPGTVLGKGGMEPDMKLTFWINVFAFHVLFLLLFVIIHRYDKTRALLEELRQTVED